MESNKEIKRRAIGFSFIVALFALLTVGSCSGPNRVPHAEPVSMPTEELADGRLLFSQYCATCHPDGMSGVGPAIVNKPLPKFLIRFQIRHGLGVMPDFDEEVLTDEQVKDIANYLAYLKKKE